VPFAPRIRKEILTALDEYVLPAFDGGSLTQFLAEPPFDFSGVRHWVVREEPLEDREFGDVLMTQAWFAEQMLAINTLTVGFVFQGERIERVGATHAMVEQAKKLGMPIPAGITAVHIPAPGFVCYGKAVPHADGTPWSHQNDSAVLALSIVAEELRVFLSTMKDHVPTTTHSLQIDDPHLLHLMRLFHQELCFRDAPKSANALFFAAMCRLKRRLDNQRPGIGNSSWPVSQPTTVSQAHATGRKYELCNEVTQYIQTHLHSALSVDELSRYFHLSPNYLSHVFKQTYGVSLMHYVALQRVNAAKNTLKLSDDRINDIAQLLGFTSTVSFCRLFKRTTGMTPSEFRYAQRKARGE